MVDALRRGRLLISLLLLLEAALVGLYLKEHGATERRPNAVSFDWSVVWGGSGREYPRGITFYENHLYVTGSTSSFGAGKEDIFLLKYGMDGRLIWNRIWGGMGYDMGRGVTRGDDGVYVAGITYPNGSSKAVLLKYDSEGRLLWARRWGIKGSAIGRCVAVDDRGFVYVAGYVRGMKANGTKAFLLKYGSEGVLIWNRTWGETGADYCWAVAVDDAIYVSGTTGSRKGVQTVGVAAPRRRSEMFLAKFDFDGDVIWTRSWGTGAENYGLALSASNGLIYQVGFTQKEADADVVLLGYDSSGNLRFSSLWGGRREDYAWGVARGGGFIYVVGHTFRTEPGSWADALIMKYTPDGGLLWNVTWGGFGSDLARSVIVEGDAVYVAGITYGVGNDGQAFLLRYTSPNASPNPLMTVIPPAAIAVGLIIWMILILEAVSKLGNLGPGLSEKVKAFNAWGIFHRGARCPVSRGI